MHPPDPRTQLLLEGPLTPTLLRLALPNVLVMVSQASAGLVETYFVGKLGTHALAAMALVFPAFMLMQMLSSGAIGGGIASAIARARGAGHHAQAGRLMQHAVVIALGFGLLTTLLMLLAGRQVYAAMGGQGPALETALRYSGIAFGGAALVWLFNALAACLRGMGNMAVPAWVTVAGLVLLVPLSPLLIFGWGPVPAFGVAGGAIALLVYYAAGVVVLLAYLARRRLVSVASLLAFRLERVLAGRILAVGLLSAVGTLCTNLSIMIATGFVGRHGAAPLAGYGTAVRLEYLLVPLVFGFGAPLLAIVGTAIGAGRRERALQAAWVGAGVVFAVTESLGLAAALFPHAWLALFTTDSAAIHEGARYLRAVAPFYGLFGVGLVLYFASQGAGRLRWAVIGNLARVATVALGGWIAQRASADLGGVYLVQVLGLVAYCGVIAWSVAGGAWFGAVGRPMLPRRLAMRMDAR